MTQELARFFSRKGAEDYYLRNRYGTCQKAMDTFDGYHFARTVNVWKAHLALHRFLLMRGVDRKLLKEQWLLHLS